MVKRVIFLVGHQYSGKSTWLSNNRVNSNTRIYSLDSVVHELCEKYSCSYEDGWKIHVKEANKILDKRLEEWVVAGFDIVLDRTNMTAKSRARYVNLFKHNDYSLSAVVFPLLDDETIKLRIKKRPEQVVPLHVVQEFRDRYEPIVGMEKDMFEHVINL